MMNKQDAIRMAKRIRREDADCRTNLRNFVTLARGMAGSYGVEVWRKGYGFRVMGEADWIEGLENAKRSEQASK